MHIAFAHSRRIWRESALIRRLEACSGAAGLVHYCVTMQNVTPLLNFATGTERYGTQFIVAGACPTVFFRRRVAGTIETERCLNVVSVVQ